MAVSIALKTFLPTLKGHHVLVRTDSMTVVAYINDTCSLRSHLQNGLLPPSVGTERTPHANGGSHDGLVLT